MLGSGYTGYEPEVTLHCRVWQGERDREFTSLHENLLSIYLVPDSVQDQRCKASNPHTLPKSN